MRRCYCSKSESNAMRYGAKSCATTSPKDLHSSTVAKASLAKVLAELDAELDALEKTRKTG